MELVEDVELMEDVFLRSMHNVFFFKVLVGDLVQCTLNVMSGL